MKKSLLTVATLFLAIGLVACDGTGDSTSGGTSTPKGDDINLEVPADKTAYVLKLKEGSVELSSFNSVFLTGPMTEWAVGLNAIEMKSDILDGYLVGYSDKYEPEEGAAGAYDYQLVVGYNSTAEIADTEKGLKWNDSFKSEECAAPGGTNNPTYADSFDATKRIANLGEHKFSAQPAAPAAPLANFTFKVTFSESVPTYAVPHFFGSFNGWQNKNWETDEEPSRMEVVENTERKTWKFTVDEIYAGTYDWLVYLDYTLEAKPDQTGFSEKKPDEFADGNLQFTVQQLMGDDHEMELDSLTFDFDVNLPDPSLIKKANLKIVVKTEGEAVADGITLCVTGKFTGWKAQEMTASADRKTFTKEYTDFTADELSFGITLGKADGSADWSHCVKAAAGANITYNFTATENTVVTIVADLAAAFNGEGKEVVYTSITPTPWVAE